MPAAILVHFKADNSQSEPDCSFVATSLDDLRDLFAETRRLHKLAGALTHFCCRALP